MTTLSETIASARELIYGMPYEEWKAKYQAGEHKPHK